MTAPRTDVSPAEAAAALGRLVEEDGLGPAEFWKRFLPLLSKLTGAAESGALRADGDGGWKLIALHGTRLTPRQPGGGTLRALPQTLAGVGPGDVPSRLDPEDAPVPGHVVLTAPLAGEAGGLLAVVCDEDDADHSEGALGMAAALPGAMMVRRALVRARKDVEKMGRVVDVVAQTNAHDRLLAAAMAFCNSLSTQAACDRVSLGWSQGGYVKLLAMSRTEKFDRKMEAAGLLEAAMDEAADQDEEVVWPPAEKSGVISRDHEAFSRHEVMPHLCSLPLRVEDEVVAVITCERFESAFAADDVDALRLACDLVTPRLVELKKQDKWFGARWAARARKGLAKVVGPEHTWMKLLGLVLVVLLAVLIFTRMDYRATATGMMRSEKMAYVSTPFDGYINEVLVQPGDAVSEGDPLLRLDTRDLELEEIAAAADLDNYRRQEEKARAAGALADMRIAAAKVEQTEARLKLIRYRLDRSVIRAGFDGVVIEGDLRERLGTAIRQGETLFRLARTDSLYVEARLDERDFHHVQGAQTGEVALVARPRDHFPVRIERVEPAAIDGEEGKVFLVRCDFQGETMDWWRPGMSGVCKINCGERPLLWILTHRTVDFLRLKLWW